MENEITNPWEIIDIFDCENQARVTSLTFNIFLKFFLSFKLSKNLILK
jgi:hypothetical protein